MPLTVCYFPGNYLCNILTLCKFWAKVRNYYEIRIINEGNCIIFLFLAKKVVHFSTIEKALKNIITTLITKFFLH